MGTDSGVMDPPPDDWENFGDDFEDDDEIVLPAVEELPTDEAPTEDPITRSPTAALDWYIGLTNGAPTKPVEEGEIEESYRAYFDVKDLDEMVAELSDEGNNDMEFLQPLYDRCEDRQFVSVDTVQGALLDLRNVHFPYTQEVEDGETQPVEPTPTEES
jgi:hypothetical protein